MSKEPAQADLLATISPTPARRLVSYGFVLTMGALLIYIAVSAAPVALIWRFMLLFLGVVILVAAERLRRATLLTLWMTDTMLLDSSGQVLCALADVSSIDRGTFAFKPSNGFLIRTKSRQPLVWRPGLWWCVGRRIGVGGATSAGQAKFMAELIALRLDKAHSP